MNFYLDTNTCIYIINEKYPHLNEKYSECDKDLIKIPSIVLFELYYGAEKSNLLEHNVTKIDMFISEIEIIPFDKQCTRLAGKIRAYLKREGQMIGDYDILIAATALANNGTLVTINTREFSRIKGLKIEDWSIT